MEKMLPTQKKGCHQPTLPMSAELTKVIRAVVESDRWIRILSLMVDNDTFGRAGGMRRLAYGNEKGRLTSCEHRRQRAYAGLGRENSLYSLEIDRQVVVPCKTPAVNTKAKDESRRVEMAYHSGKLDSRISIASRFDCDCTFSHAGINWPIAHMKEIGEKYESLLGPYITSSSPKIAFYSTVLKKVVKKEKTLNAAYWRKNLESPVLFNTTMEALLIDHNSNNLFLEIGPHYALAGPLRQIFKQCQPDALYLSTLARGSDDTLSLLTALGNLFVKGVAVDLSPINQGGQVVTGLPTYP
ncbi:hypothetical protein SUNI508_11657 [Seiridium unicorne]|uniref:Malonyl-CoA:ACP transacylase (MAT) domain-containing protein n=1 Tax=Seiridium unicorne TaxID=138068 RepID=A0ABR2UH56_9PEZI